MTDTILSITIWKQPIVEYQIQHQPYTHHQKPPSTAVKYALISGHDKLLHPPILFYLMSTFNSIVCSVVLSGFGLLAADCFTLVKIDDRYPDEWNDQILILMLPLA